MFHMHLIQNAEKKTQRKQSRTIEYVLQIVSLFHQLSDRMVLFLQFVRVQIGQHIYNP